MVRSSIFIILEMMLHVVRYVCCETSSKFEIISCDFEDESMDHKDRQKIYICRDNGSIIISSDTINSTDSLLPGQPKYDWYHMLLGTITKKEIKRKPLSSCLSSMNGSGAKKSFSLTEVLSVSSSLSFTLPFFDILFLSSGIAMGLGITASIERSVEYSCDAKAGQIVQIVLSSTEYSIKGWKIRPLVITTPSSPANIGSNEWENIPEIHITKERENVQCVTNTSQLMCDVL